MSLLRVLSKQNEGLKPRRTNQLKIGTQKKKKKKKKSPNISTRISDFPDTMRSATGLIMATAILLLKRSTAKPDLEVNTKLGRIRGTTVTYKGTTVTAFLSVPFAKPPTGGLRFRRPEPADPWKGVLDAISFPPACPQYTPTPFPWYDNMTGHSEDCLYLNIWVPSPSKENRTVIYWIFSGGFNFGSNRLPVYDGRALAATGDVIVVSVNYRLGPLGFLYTGTDDAPGNVGLYDSLLGLKWVNENIDAFGGDSNSITISGQSAGSMICGLFSVSPLAKGLYKRIIAESGSPFDIWDDGKSENLVLGQKLAERFGCADEVKTIVASPDKVVECLRGIDANDLARASGEMKPDSTMIFKVVFDDPIVGGNPKEKLRTGDFHDSDVLAGNVPDEGATIIVSKHPDIFGYFGEKNTTFTKDFGEQALEDVAPGLVNRYLGDVNDGDQETIKNRTITALSDFNLLCTTVYYAELLSMNDKNKVYYYFFTRRPSDAPYAEWLGIAHFYEVEYVFGIPTMNPDSYTEEEVALSEQMMTMWTNFAKNGKPSDDWPLYDKKSHKGLVLGDPFNPEVHEIAHIPNCDFLRPLFGLSDADTAPKTAQGKP